MKEIYIVLALFFRNICCTSTHFHHKMNMKHKFKIKERSGNKQFYMTGPDNSEIKLRVKTILLVYRRFFVINIRGIQFLKLEYNEI